MHKNIVFIILGNQLFPISNLKGYKNHKLFMCEDYGLCTYEKHHKLKLLFFLSSMRSYADKLKDNKFDIHYIDLNSKFKISYEDKLEFFIKKNKITEINSFEIEDKFFENRILKLSKKLELRWVVKDSPMFLTKRNDFKTFLSSYKKPLMANFYKLSRKKNNILMIGDKPKGGKWNFDLENRKKLPKKIFIPDLISIKETEHTKNLKKTITTIFSTHPGLVDNFWFPTTHYDANKWLDHFIKEKLNLFGDYEDAVDQNNNVLFHSVLSPLINIGLITPNQILEKIKYLDPKYKMNSLEGFIRQIIGWREFIRGIYQNYDKQLENGNFFNHKRMLSDSWYEGTTGLLPLDHSIRNVIKYGWTHHIERLMILVNIMNLCEVKPKIIYKWFMEMFVDSSDWVMSPNIYGMGLFSDGGIFSTKPYICGSSYFLRMMNFKKGNWCDTMDGLYWRFISKNTNFFKSNPRLSLMIKILEKMDKQKKIRIFKAADSFILKNTNI